jgi:hypothetical protein
VPSSGVSIARGVFAISFVALVAGCDRRRGNEGQGTTAPAPPIQASAVPMPVAAPPIAGDARDALRDALGTPVKPGRLIASIEPATNGDPQANAAGVLVAAVGGGKVVTAYSVDGDVRVGGPLDLGTARFVATDGPHVCAANRSVLRCAWVDGTSSSAREAVADTTGLWGGPGVLLRGVGAGTSWSLEASHDGFLTTRKVQAPARWRVADVEIETTDKWSAVTIPMEGNPKPRLALTNDGGRTPIADFGAVDRLGWSYGDRLWPNQLVTGALATELVVAEHGEKQSTVPLPWAAAGGFAWAKGSIVLFGKGATGSGGFMLVEVAGKRVTNFTPPGLQPIIAAGRVGLHIVAITTAGKVVAWGP